VQKKKESSRKSLLTATTTHPLWCKKTRCLQGRVFLRPPPPILSGAKKQGVFKEESSYGHHHPSMLSGAYFKYLDMASITFVLVVLCALMTAYKEKNQNSPDQKQFYTFMEKLLRM